MSSDNKSGLQDCECLIECDGKGSLGGGERCRAERLRLLRELNAVMVKPDNESGEQAEWPEYEPKQHWQLDGRVFIAPGTGERMSLDNQQDVDNIFA